MRSSQIGPHLFPIYSAPRPQIILNFTLLQICCSFCFTTVRAFRWQLNARLYRRWPISRPVFHLIGDYYKLSALILLGILSHRDSCPPSPNPPVGASIANSRLNNFIVSLILSINTRLQPLRSILLQNHCTMSTVDQSSATVVGIAILVAGVLVVLGLAIWVHILRRRVWNLRIRIAVLETGNVPLQSTRNIETGPEPPRPHHYDTPPKQATYRHELASESQRSF